jgi:Ribbon-helix-helix protein, copG family
MRTTIRVDDELLKQVKLLAAELGTTLTSIFEDALRAFLAARRSDGAEGTPFSIAAFDPGPEKGVRPGVDLDDSAALLELMERDDRPL